MNRELWKPSVLLAGLGALTLLASPVIAQDPGGPPPDRPPFDRPMQDGPQSGRPPFERGGRAGFGSVRPATAENVPLSALSAGLSLKEDQRDRIARIKRQGRPTQASTRPMSSQPGSEQAVEAALTEAQRQALPALLQTFSALRSAGIPLTVYADLKLTATQNAQLAALAPSGAEGMRGGQQMGEKVMVLLTDAQKDAAMEARDEARLVGGSGGPPPGGGRFSPGRGGGGPGRRGGPDGGRPEDGMRGGPPPDGGPGGGGPPPDGPPPPDGF